MMQVRAMKKFSCRRYYSAVGTYKWRTKIFHSDTTCSPGGIHDVFHQTVSFHTKAQSGSIRQFNNSQ